jgi:thymidylate kinase
MTHPGTLVIVDAIDGAGKYTAIKAMADHLAAKGLKIFNLSEYTQREHRLPSVDEPGIAEADILISSEPTFCWIGAAIREEIIKAQVGRSYHAHAAAEAFALDRQVLFTRVILPFLQAKPNRYVLQERGVISSLAYQPLQDETVTVDWLLSLEGNRAELSRPPDLLFLLRLTSEEAMKRLGGRLDKVDGHIYEEQSFQERLIARYRDLEVLGPYQKAGTRIVEINANQSPEAVGQAVCNALAELR